MAIGNINHQLRTEDQREEAKDGSGGNRSGRGLGRVNSLLFGGVDIVAVGLFILFDLRAGLVERDALRLAMASSEVDASRAITRAGIFDILASSVIRLLFCLCSRLTD
ncbi:hypothetical protein [Rhizobium giardinii]|uniref:hypothetical protein n=1 Tax=Rhizobium giardinii TaxID=56731 RepID=UPI003D6F3FB0